MASIRRGLAAGPGPPDAARVNAGRMASSSGSAIAIPDPRRKCRRDSARRATRNGPTAGVGRSEGFMGLLAPGALLVEEETTLDDLMDQGTQAVAARARALDDALDL